MSIQSTLSRIETIRQAIADPAELIAPRSAATGGVEAPSSGSFADALAQANASGQAGLAAASEDTTGVAEAVSPDYGYALGSMSGVATGSTASGPGAAIVAAAESQIGQSEQPPGSNESPAIAGYREATAGAMPGAPWCAYFASWAARQAGEPIGSSGQGLGSVGEIWSWAQSTGRAVANGPGVVPKPGDLIVFGDEHVGIVRGVLPSGQIETIEGNYENKVSANVRSDTEATGYVSMS
jgi:CHAP domain